MTSTSDLPPVAGSSDAGSNDADSGSRFRGRLFSMSFVCFLTSQGLGAVNDSMFRWLIVPIAKYRATSVEGLSGADVERLEARVLAIGLGCFVLPFIVFAPWAGWISDRFSKRKAMIALKYAEVAIMVLGSLAIWFGNTNVMFVVLFLMGLQSALLSPAKMGIIPEIVKRESISAANGLVGLITVVSVVGGTVVGGYLYSVGSPDGLSGLMYSATALIAVAAVGTLATHGIAKVPVAAPNLSFPVNLLSSSLRDLRLVFSSRPILRVCLGIAFFWSVAALAQLNVDTYVIRELALGQRDVGTLLALLSIGVALGSVLAGYWSGGRVELGIVPLGTILIAISSILLAITSTSSVATGAMLLILGVGGGLFNIPLAAWLQERVPRKSLGAVLAASNLLTFTGMLLVSIGYPLLRWKLSAPQVFLVTGLASLPILIYVIWLLPQATIRFAAWLLSRTVYRIRIRGAENVPDEGPALLVSNHVTWIDGLLLVLTSSRPIRMLAYADYAKMPGLRWLSNLFGIIPIRPGDGPRAIMEALGTARESLNNGELVCIFAEGQITRTGQLLKFEKGALRILQGTDAPVVPVYLGGLWGSIFSYHSDQPLHKKPIRWPYPVTISFGRPLRDVSDISQIRHAVEELSAHPEATPPRGKHMILAQRFIRQCKRGGSRVKVADSAKTELTGRKLLIGTLAFRAALRKHVFDDGDERVGILLPPSAGGVLANTACTLDSRVTINLNYTLSEDVVNFCIRKSGIKKVLTSRKFLEKRPFDLDAEVVLLEDLKTKITGFDKAKAAAMAMLPTGLLERILGLGAVHPDSLMTVIFTSGSTGEPKGVMLSHRNVQTNIDAVNDVFQFTTEDCLIGVLPFFHSFGYTVTMWLPLCHKPSVVYHFNPLDSRTVGELAEKYSATIIVATPTFLRGYLKRCTPEQFHAINLVIVGAEKMPDELSVAFKERFGTEPTEGYGTTELSPVASFNIPDSRLRTNTKQTGTKAGSVGRVIPGSTAAVRNPDTREILGANQEGLLYIKGPNVMLGYLDEPEKTAEVIHDGWYDTGDIATIDPDGFITITGRQSRFSKIGGEMVPHVRIEQELSRIVDDADSDDPEILVAVTAVPDRKKGERLIVLHKPFRDRTIEDLQNELRAAGLPNLWIPSSDSFLEVENIPLLGTGKLDLKGVRDKALEHFGS